LIDSLADSRKPLSIQFNVRSLIVSSLLTGMLASMRRHTYITTKGQLQVLLLIGFSSTSLIDLLLQEIMETDLQMTGLVARGNAGIALKIGPWDTNVRRC
jgi:hypothetical protein